MCLFFYWEFMYKSILFVVNIGYIESSLSKRRWFVVPEMGIPPLTMPQLFCFSFLFGAMFLLIFPCALNFLLINIIYIFE